MNCTEIKNLMIDRIDNNLPSAIIRQLDAHLEYCESCQEDFIQTGNLLTEIEKIEDEQPDASLKDNFYSLLNTETQKVASQKTSIVDSINKRIVLTRMKYAAVIIILLSIGYLAGNFSSQRKSTKTEIAALKGKVEQLQQYSYLISLNQPSASERLRIINAVNKNTEIDDELLSTLVNTLNNDDNVNVRMAAAYALAKYPDTEYVRTSLVQSLELQTEPILQISLIGILVDFQDNRAKPILEKIIKDENIIPAVKQHAQQSLDVFRI